MLYLNLKNSQKFSQRTNQKQKIALAYNMMNLVISMNECQTG